MFNFIGGAVADIKARAATTAELRAQNSPAKSQAPASQPSKVPSPVAKTPPPAKMSAGERIAQARREFEQSAFQREMAEGWKNGFKVFKSCATHYQLTFAGMDARAWARTQAVQFFCPPRPVKRPWGTQIEQPSANLGSFANPEGTPQPGPKRENVIQVQTQCLQSAAQYSCCALLSMKAEGVLCFDRFDAQPPH